MKRFNSVVAVFGLAAGAAMAQPPGPPPGGRLDLDNFAILLDLDAYQKGEVDRVLTEQREAMRAEREALRAQREQGATADERPSREAMRQRREQSRDEVFAKLENTLTEQQLTKLKILIDSPQGGRGPRGRPF